MECRIDLGDPSPDPNVIQDALFDVDPTAVVELDMTGSVL